MKHNKDAFTLIELLVAVLIIGILAAVAFAQYQKAVEKIRATEAFILGKAIINSAERFYLAHGVYPDSFDNLDISFHSTGNSIDSHNTDIRTVKFYKFQIGGVLSQSRVNIASTGKRYQWFNFYFNNSSGRGKIFCRDEQYENSVCQKFQNKYVGQLSDGWYQWELK
jgi:prepilin-type N-terminal cleavage/methylation domain-containing protein